MLRLIPNSSQPVYKGHSCQMIENKIPAPKGPLQNSFLWDFQEISPGIYIARFQDTFHELSCKVALELKESFIPSGGQERGYFELILAADFPSIDIQLLQQKALWDEYLYGTLLIQFQLKVLEQLLLFCEDRDATHIFLSFNEANHDYIEIYQRFIISEEEIPSNHREKIEIIIPTDVSIYDELIDFMEEIDHSFRHTLWREKGVNSIYRQYLKSEALR